jgi:ribokinase
MVKIITNQKKEPNILVIGGFTMDLVVRTPRAPENGETILGTDFNRFPGGKGGNQAVAAARLGGNVTMIGKLGTDSFGDEVFSLLEKDHINTRFVERVRNYPTGIGSIVLDDNGDNRIIVIPGANSQVKAEHLPDYLEAFKQADMLLVQLELDFEMNLKAVDLAYEMDIPVLLNPAPGRELSDDLLKKVSYLTPNETEAEIITGIPIRTLEDAKAAVKILLEKGVNSVVMTLAGEGALIGDAKGIRRIPGFKVKAIDTVAAGDSFNGALAYYILNGMEIDDAVYFANAVGALTVTKEGAIPSLPNRQEVDAFLQERGVLV